MRKFRLLYDCLIPIHEGWEMELQRGAIVTEDSETKDLYVPEGALAIRIGKYRSIIMVDCLEPIEGGDER